MTTPERLQYLFNRYVEKSETPDENEELMELITNEEYRQQFEQLMDQAREQLSQTARLDKGQTERLFQSIADVTTEKQVVMPLKTSGKKWLWWKVAAAASILLVMGAGAYFYFFDTPPPASQQTEQLPAATPDLKAPVISRAVITLANGREIYLDSLSNGAIAEQGNMQVMKLPDGRIAYQSTRNEPSKSLQYNTLTNPRGSRVIGMTLADGSHVWLNAGSSVTYPVAFTGQERIVSIQGEAYFEVAKNRHQPFIVNINEHLRVQVLGTHFNINGFADEGTIRATLLEGSVQVKQSTGSVILKPGQQARVSSKAAERVPEVVKNVDVDQVMAWKHGFFNFNDADVQLVMAQLERWYDIQVQYEGAVPDILFKGELDRKVNLSDVLRYLSKVGISAKLKGRILKVSAL